MLVFVYSDELSLANKEAYSLAKEKLKGKDAEFKVLEAEGFLKSDIEELVSSSTLFYHSSLYLIKNLQTNKDAWSKFLSHLNEFLESKNLFIVSGEDNSKKDIETICKKAICKKIKSAETKNNDEKKFFSVLDRFFKGDKKAALELLNICESESKNIEQIYGLIWWYLKLVIYPSQDAQKDLKAFVFQKHKAFKILEPELEGKVQEFALLPQVASAKNLALKDLLKKWLLEVLSIVDKSFKRQK